MKFLIVIDPQEALMVGEFSTPDTTKIIPNIQKKLSNREKYDKIIFTRYNERCLDEENENPFDWSFVDELTPQDKDTVIYKDGYGSLSLVSVIYSHLPKKDYINEDLSDIEQIELCGVYTDDGIISNALILRSAFPNTKIIINSQCCAGTTYKSHIEAINVMKKCQIEII